MDDRRVSQYKNSWCIDCNAEEYSDGICTFASDYFPDHSTSFTATTDLVNMLLKCPF